MDNRAVALMTTAVLVGLWIITPEKNEGWGGGVLCLLFIYLAVTS